MSNNLIVLLCSHNENVLTFGYLLTAFVCTCCVQCVRSVAWISA